SALEPAERPRTEDPDPAVRVQRAGRRRPPRGRALGAELDGSGPLGGDGRRGARGLRASPGRRHRGRLRPVRCGGRSRCGHPRRPTRPTRRAAFEIKMGRRTKARECALQMLYQWDLTRAPMDEVAASFWRVRTSTDATKAMAERLARGAQANAARLDGLIGEAATNWRFDRIAAVDRNLLRLGAYELDMERDTPSSVVIDEAVEIAKR